MFARKTLAIPAAFITLLAGAVPVQAGLLDLIGPSSSANWTLGGVPCTLIPVPAAAPFSTGTCPGVRPGAIVLSDVGQCTLNFLFVGSDGSRYIGTAGHCILGTSPFGGDVGEMAWAPGTGPEARDAGGNRIGEIAYAILQDPKGFSLIRLDAQVQASAGTCHFSRRAPGNHHQPRPPEPAVLKLVGHRVGGGAVLPARSAAALWMPRPDHPFA